MRLTRKISLTLVAIATLLGLVVPVHAREETRAEQAPPSKDKTAGPQMSPEQLEKLDTFQGPPPVVPVGSR